MTDERAIEQLEEFLVIDDWSAVYMPYLQDAIEYVINRIKADNWISVKDKLPDKEGRCLVFTDYGDVTMDSYRCGLFVCNLGNVTHWKPLPKAPESEDKEC